MAKKKKSAKPKKPKAKKDDGKDLDEVMGALLKVPPKKKLKEKD